MLAWQELYQVSIFVSYPYGRACHILCKEVQKADCSTARISLLQCSWPAGLCGAMAVGLSVPGHALLKLLRIRSALRDSK